MYIVNPNPNERFLQKNFLKKPLRLESTPKSF